MATRAQLLTEGLTWLGTPWKHRTCLKGKGVDCVRLIEGIAKAVGIFDPAWKPPIYSPEWHLHKNEEMLQQVMQELGFVLLPLAARLPGDVLGLQFGRVVSHLGLAAPADEILHSTLDIGHVVLQRLGGDLERRLRVCYRFPGVEDMP